MRKDKVIKVRSRSFLYFLLFILLLAGCKKEQPQAITIPTPDLPITGITAIDPTIAAVLAQISPSPEATTASQDLAAPPAETPEFICNPPVDWVAYTVQSNDTLFAIADVLGISIDDIKSANCMLTDTLSTGEQIFLPAILPIPQAAPVIQPLNPTINMTQEQIISTGIAQELAFMAGGGGWSLNHNCNPDGVYGPVLTSDQSTLLRQFFPTFEVVVCEPATTTFSITLVLPTGEELPGTLKESSESLIIEASYKLPLGHPYGIYTVILDNYPEAGMTMEKQVLLGKGLPTLKTDAEARKIHLYYFEPEETVLLSSYRIQNVDNNFSVELLTVHTYQVNEKGYLIVDVDPNMWPAFAPNNSGTPRIDFAVIGEQSGFASESLRPRLTIKNYGLEPICELWLTSTTTHNQTELISERVDQEQIKQGQAWSRLILSPDHYRIEARDCSGNVLHKTDNIDLTQESAIWEIP